MDVREDSEACGSAVRVGARRKRDTQPAVNVTSVPQDVLLTIVNLNYTQAGVTYVRMASIHRNIFAIVNKQLEKKNPLLDYLRVQEFQQKDDNYIL